MVKNTKGGKGAKSLARKMVFADTKEKKYIRLPTCPLEQFAVTTKMYGNMCQVTTNDGESYKCVIRGKFSGRKKRQSFVAVGKIILVGFRDFEAPNFKFCDLLEVYDDNEIQQLTTTPGLDIQSLVSQMYSLTSSSCSSSSHPQDHLDDIFSSYSSSDNMPLFDSSHNTMESLAEGDDDDTGYFDEIAFEDI
jgi:hypothetical protein